MTGRQRKLYERILLGTSDANLPLKQVRGLLLVLGFEERVESSHHVFTRRGLSRPIPLQDVGGGKCKPYQVRMVRDALRGRDHRVAERKVKRTRVARGTPAYEFAASPQGHS